MLCSFAKSTSVRVAPPLLTITSCGPNTVKFSFPFK
ncbi:MAG: hypothetical protein ACI9GM_001366 [Salibacteraceae bacterium]